IEGQSFFGQTINYRKDGSEFVNQWDIHPLENEQGEITHWVSYQHDVTDRKNAEINLSFDPATEFDTLDELGKSIIIDFDTQGNILYANKAFREMSNFQMDMLKTR
ncbi:PAS domain S-box protein, partial [Arthrospira platensis SPKY1]|nr:PAS domain S-box protein [Arthrospira platensis SPKY1]